MIAAVYGLCAGARPMNGVFQFNLGIAREMAGDLPGAFDALLAACRLNPRNWRLVMRAAKTKPALDPEIRRGSAIADRVIARTLHLSA